MMKPLALVFALILALLLGGLLAAVYLPSRAPSPTPAPATTAASTPSPVAPLAAEAAPSAATPTVLQTPTPQVDCATFAPDTLAKGKQQQDIGDDGAVTAFQSILTLCPSSMLAGESRFRLGESLIDAHREADAIATLLALVEAEPQHVLAGAALLLAANVQNGAGNITQSIELYDRYLQRDAPLAAYAQREKGGAYATLQQPEKAIQAYTSALDAGLPDDAAQAARRAIAGLAAGLKQYDTALSWWERFQANARSATERGLALYSAALIKQETGERAAATEGFQQLVSAYGETWYGLQALQALLAAGAEPPLLQQANVYFANRQNEQAVAAYERYLAASPQGAPAALALYRLAILQQRLGKLEAAMALYDDVHERFPNESFVRDAWLEVGLTLKQLDRKLEAAMFFEKLSVWYPNAVETERALWEAGMLYYRLNRPKDAARALGVLRERFPASRTLARTTLWHGKALQAMGDTAGARAAWTAIAADPRPDYYNLRAAELLGSAAPAPAATPATATTADERAQLLRWMEGWAGAQSTVDVSSDVHLQRALLLSRVRLHDDALTEFSLARAAQSGSAWGLLALAEYARDAGYPRQAMLAANGVLALANTPLREAPRCLLRLLYPLGYEALVREMAAEHGLDPLWYFALIRQESAFDRYAYSSADARGLTQVIPATATETARRLSMPDFRQDDLFKPALSLRFGAWLLSQNLMASGNDMFVSLAGYNGGLGNALRWAESLTTMDKDLYVETIGFSETYAFVRLIYEHHDMYVRLWAAP